jgi:hypothetical protein
MDIVHTAAYLGSVRGFGDGVFWNDWEAPRATLWSWTKGGQAVRLVQGPWDVAHFAVSTERVVWLGVQGIEASSGGYDSAVLYWSPFATDPGEVILHEGPSLPVPFNSGPMHTAGDWAVVPACQDAEDCAMLVVRFSDQRVWSIPGRPGEGYYEVPLAITDTELVVEESVQISHGGPDGYLRLLRYDLSLLDSYATVLQ